MLTANSAQPLAGQAVVSSAPHFALCAGCVQAALMTLILAAKNAGAGNYYIPNGGASFVAGGPTGLIFKFILPGGYVPGGSSRRLLGSDNPELLQESNRFFASLQHHTPGRSLKARGREPLLELLGRLHAGPAGPPCHLYAASRAL